MRRIVTLVALGFLLVTPTWAAGPQIVEVTGRSGVKAWLVEDHKLPLITMSFSFAGGVETDPADKQGLAVLATSLATQGAGPYDERAFQDRLAARSIQMDLSAGRDYVTGKLKTLRRTKDEAFRLLSLALTQPRIDEATFLRVREGQLTAAKAQLANPGWQGRVALYRQLFGEHPYAYRSLGSQSSLLRLTQADVHAFLRGRLARDHLTIAVAGDLTPRELKVLLDSTFASLPAQSAPLAIQPVNWPQRSAVIHVARDGEQTNLLLAAPMLRRDDPDWYAAETANYILGGGGFTSRLMAAVRAKQGLTYGISTSLNAMEKTSMIMGQVSMANGKAGEVLDLVRSVWQDFFDNGVSEGEIEAAKDFLTGSLPLALTTTDSIAAVLLTMQTDKLGIDYLDRYPDKIRAVTPQAVARVMRAWFDPSRISLSLVGRPQGVQPDQTQEMLKE